MRVPCLSAMATIKPKNAIEYIKELAKTPKMEHIFCNNAYSKNGGNIICTVPTKGRIIVSTMHTTKYQSNNRKYGVVLTAKDVVEIYRCKLQFSVPVTFKSSLFGIDSRTKGQSSRVAKQFGVSPKTIRDIWNKRTWTCATAHLWFEGTTPPPSRLVSMKTFVEFVILKCCRTRFIH